MPNKPAVRSHGWTSRVRLALSVGLGLFVSACAPRGYVDALRTEGAHWRTPGSVATIEFPAVATFPSWTSQDEAYRLFPGDVIDFQSIGAPEINRKLTVAPDGRIHPPMLAPMMAGDRTLDDLKSDLESQYGALLRNPVVTLAPESFASQKFYVGGEVAKPGIYDLTGETDPLQAIVLAGGFLNSARREEVVVLRRGAGGQPFMRIYNLKSAWSSQALMAELPRLRRFDVVWVPKSTVAELGLFTQQFVRDALPVTIGFNYSIGNNFR